MPQVKDRSIKYTILLSLSTGEKRFSELKKEVKRPTLAKELPGLERDGLIQRNVDPSTRPVRITYSITQRGKEDLHAAAGDIIRTMKERLRLLQRVVPAKHTSTDSRSTENDEIANTYVDRTIARAVENIR
jgi:DNA-binding HxlR family transcriptional regulator